MKASMFAVALGLCPLALAAQQAIPEPDRTYTSAAEIKERIAKAEALVKAGKPVTDMAIRSLASAGPFHAHLVYRGKPALYFVNDDFTEFYVILEGAGEMTLGSTLVNPKRTGPHAESAVATGGTPYKVAKGDMLIVPAGVAHRVSAVDGKLAYMSIHLPLEPKL